MKSKRKTIKVLNAAGRICAEIDGTILIKRVSGEIHRLRQPKAWAYDTTIIEQARASGVERLVIVDTDNGDRYETSLPNFYENMGKLNRGFGEQVFLTLDRWTLFNNSKDQPRLL